MSQLQKSGRISCNPSSRLFLGRNKVHGSSMCRSFGAKRDRSGEADCRSRLLKLALMLMRAIIVAAMLIIQPLAASAVSLGRVDVASHLNEAFFAEIALNLDKDESLSSIFVDLASPVEYRFLEVYRDQAIDNLRTTIKQDKRGLRVEITSNKALKSPYINLVLRVRHGRATHFKKFPIFLSLPSVATPKIAQGKPVVTIAKTATQPIQTTAQATSIKKEGFAPFSDWARTNRYGPMVYGDTLFTVARRLRIDKRYSVRQVAMALFNKNRDKFSQGNINLIKAGSYLNTPTANEVAALSPSAASAAMIAQTKAWQRLKQQPKFARVAEAQKNRYSKRVRVGSQGEGVRHTSTTPAAIAASKPQVVAVHTPTAAAIAPVKVTATPATTSKPTLSTEAQQRIAQLKTDNEILQATVTANNKRLAKLEKQLTTSTATSNDPKLKLLEAHLMRIQRQLQQERTNNKSDMLMWLIYAAAAIIVLLIVVIGVLMRRQPPHPAQLQQKPQSAPSPIAETVAETVETTVAEKEAAPATTTIAETKVDSAESEAQETTDSTSADPDVDYLTEADVYLRYGMEDEAEAQVELALQLRPDDPAAHAKLVEVREARGNKVEAEAAKTAALALLTGAALATFEQLLTPTAQQEETNEPETSEKSTAKTTTEERSEIAAVEVSTPQASDDDDLLASIAPPNADNEIDALLDIQNETPSYHDDNDDELQQLLSIVDSETSESEENSDDDILDLSMDSTIDTDLASLMSSLTTSDDDASTQNILPEEENMSPDISSTDTIEQASTAKATAETEPSAEPVETSFNDMLSGDLDFDTSDLDLSKAKTEEPRINTTSVDSDSDLAFDASDLDLSGIELPSSSATATSEKTAIEPSTAGDMKHSDAISLDLSDSTSAVEAEATVTKAAEPTTPAASGSTLDISLDMDDLDALLANDASPQPTPEKQPQKTTPEAPQSVDDELESLLEGLDDIDLNGNK